jgi:hypothetical protein
MSYNSPFTGTVIQPTDVSYRAVTLTANTQLNWPINGNATDDYAARIMQVTASTAGLSLFMPPANQASVGADALIRNVGSNTFTVKDYAGTNTLITIAAGETKYVYITTNPDTQGTWGNIAFGVGSSSADAATLAGYGVLAISSTLNQSHPVSTFSSNETASASYRAQTNVWTGGSGTFTLPSAISLGNNWFTMVRNGGSGTLSISTNGSDLFNGSTTVLLQPADSCMIVCSGSAFYSVGLSSPTQFNFTQLTKPLVSGSYTLTSAEAANVIIKFTGALSGNCTVIIPQTVQVYYILNETTGIYSVTVTTGVSGAQTATLTSANQVTLVCDSVNLFNANTTIAGASILSVSDGTVGTPGLNFNSETSTGLYRPATGNLSMAVLGVQMSALTSTGLTIYGTGTFTGGISGGTF